jgi:eukaryotic-like serine/threonine-protein kinase
MSHAPINSLELFLRSPETWPETSALLDEAMALEGNERQQWLENLYKSDPQKAGLIAQILREESSILSGDFLKRPPAFQAMLMEDLSSSLAATPEVAGVAELTEVTETLDSIGPYRLIRELGRGGMGVVWLAERMDGSLNRQVALKTLINVAQRSDLKERFLRERDILARLEHPNIARLYDAGISELGQPYLVLQYVEGLPINDYCAEQRLTIRERIALFGKVLAAVKYAHSCLIIHRDIKPSNILVTPRGEVRLLDFGIAKLLLNEAGAAAETELTFFSGKALTLEYASPEQIRGEPLTVAADIYSLGVVLYELLTDRRPHQADRPSQAALEEIILHDDAVPPSVALRNPPSDNVALQRRSTLSALQKDMRGNVDAIVMTAIAKLAKQRYATVALLASDLDAWASGLPVSARRESVVSRARRFVVRYKTLVAAATVVVLALTAGTAVAMWQAGIAKQNQALAQTQSALAQEEAARAQSEAAHALAEAKRADTEAERARINAKQAEAEATRANQLAQSESRSLQQARNAETEARKQTALALKQAKNATAAKDFMESTFRANSSNQADPVKARQTTAVQLLDLAADRIESSMKDTPELKQETIDTLADLYLDLGLDDKAVALLQQRVALLEQVGNTKSQGFASALVGLAAAQQGSKQVSDREKILNRAEGVLNSLDDYTSVNRGRLHKAFAQHYSTTNSTLAVKHAQRAVDISRKYPTEKIALASALYQLGFSLNDQREHAMAEAPLLEAVNIAEQAGADNRYMLTKFLAQLGSTQNNLQKYSQAEHNLRRAYENAVAISGMDHVDVIQTQKRVGVMLASTSRLKEGLPELEQAKSIALRVLGADESFHTPIVVLEHGFLLARLGRLREGLRDVGAAVGNRRKNIRGPLALAQLIECQAAILTELGDYAEAITLLDETDAMRANSGSKPISQSYNGHLNMRVKLMVAIGKHDDAKKLLSQYFVEAGYEQHLSQLWLIKSAYQIEADIGLSNLPEAAQLANAVRTRIEADANKDYLKVELAQMYWFEGRIAHAHGDQVTAKQRLQRALELMTDLYEPISPRILAAQSLLAEVLAAQGDFNGAMRNLNSAQEIEKFHGTLGTQYVSFLRNAEAKLKQVSAKN